MEKKNHQFTGKRHLCNHNMLIQAKSGTLQNHCADLGLNGFYNLNNWMELEFINWDAFRMWLQSALNLSTWLKDFIFPSVYWMPLIH